MQQVTINGFQYLWDDVGMKLWLPDKSSYTSIKYLTDNEKKQLHEELHYRRKLDDAR